MDADKFDALVARLVAAQSRRQALTGVGGALSSLGVAVVAESRRKRAKGGANKRGKHGDHKADHQNGQGDRQEDGSAERLGRRNRKRKHDRHKDRKHDDKKKKKKSDKRKARCKKNGQPCVRDSKCCSKHCEPNTGTCIRKPGS